MSEEIISLVALEFHVGEYQNFFTWDISKKWQPHQVENSFHVLATLSSILILPHILWVL